ncbi:SRPBCC family protein [Undibacterium terreum]|uniref:MxaD family protein n=1 Tax=Undibacterium terreum TaxID=1224302 RepID=A0A916UBL1_9BURK|nr:SRPBCC family protein [Undibacterium terreum]GGC66568.1 MxaD family protein [Undibacterium terreum]
MSSTTASIEIAATPDQVWQLIGGFDSLPNWLPYIPRSELSHGGRVRRLETPAGDVIIERLQSFNEKERYYSYSIMQAPFPASNYVSMLRVREANDNKGSLVEWSGSFTPVGVSDEEVTQLFHGIYTDGLDALKKNFTN